MNTNFRHAHQALKTGRLTLSCAICLLVGGSLFGAGNGNGGNQGQGNQTVNRSEFADVFNEMELRRSQNNGKGNVQGQAKRASKQKAMRPLQEFSSVDDGESLAPRVLKQDFPENLRSLVSEGASFREKSEVLGSLRHGDLDEAECAALISFIQVREQDADGRETPEFLSLKNDALLSLIELDPVPAQLGHTMISMVRDETEDPIWREYVLQHFSMYYRARWSHDDTNQKTSPNQRGRIAIQKTLAAAIYHEDSGLSGTALIVLQDLAADYPEFQGSFLRRAAKRVARDADCCISSRITALSLISGDPDDEEVDLAALLASDDALPLGLRVAATGRLMRWSDSAPNAHLALNELSRSNGRGKATEHVAKMARKKFDEAAVVRETKSLLEESTK